MSILAEQQHERLINTVAERYRHDGYDVVTDPDANIVPFDLGPYRPDLVARKGGVKEIVEIRTEANRISFDQVQSITEEVKRHDGWRFVLVTAQDILAPDSPIENDEDFSWDEATRRVKDAQRLREMGESEAAYMSLWIAFERMMGSQARRVSLPMDRLAPAILIRQLYSQGELSMGQFDTALHCQEIRNRVVHGFPVSDVSDHLKTYFFERRADRYLRGPIGKGSIHELCRPQTAHRHSDWGWAELGEVISGTP